MQRLLTLCLLAVASTLGTAGTAPAAFLLVNQTNIAIPPFGYGGGSFGITTAALDSAFGAVNITTSATPLDAVGLAGYDALWLDLRDLGPTGALSASEQAALSAFAASGKRVAIIGENTAWTDWNNSFLSVFGGTNFDAPFPSTETPTAFMHPITAGIVSIDVVAPSGAAGGINLTENGVVALFGPSNNVAVVMDVNAMTDDYPNSLFKSNLANWLAAPADPGPPSATPAPPALAAFGLGLVVLSGLSRRRRQSIV